LLLSFALTLVSIRERSVTNFQLLLALPARRWKTPGYATKPVRAVLLLGSRFQAARPSYLSPVL
jgi:hypothetical protein